MTKRLDPAATGRLYAPVPVSSPDEKWRDAVGFEGRYLVSSKGRLYGMYSGNFLRPNKTRRGYLRTSFRAPAKSTGQRYVGVHAVVAAAFIGPCPDGLEVNHKNGIKTDNRVENLEYGTHRYNVKHAYDIGLSKGGRGSKLDANKVRELRRMWAEAERTVSKRGKPIIKKGELRKIADHFGIATAYVHNVCVGDGWSSL
jgi:hypothetical protein